MSSKPRKSAPAAPIKIEIVKAETGDFSDVLETLAGLLIDNAERDGTIAFDRRSAA